MSTRFREFLRRRAEEVGAPDRIRKRDEWVVAVRDFLNEIQGWLGSADPDRFLEVIPYAVQRVEGQIGIYDAPALKIRLGPDEVDVVPVGRYQIGFLPDAPRNGLLGLERDFGHRVAGRVDVTDGERRVAFFRLTSGSEIDQWFVLDERGGEPSLLNQDQFENVLLGFWS